MFSIFAPSVLDLLFSSGTVKFEKWASLIICGRLRQYALILVMMGTQMAFYVEHALCIGGHKEWLVLRNITYCGGRYVLETDKNEKDTENVNNLVTYSTKS